MKNLFLLLPLFLLSFLLASCEGLESKESFPTEEGVTIVEGNVEETTLQVFNIGGQEVTLGLVTTYYYNEEGVCEKIEEKIHCPNPIIAALVSSALKSQIEKEDDENSFIEGYELDTKNSIISASLKPEVLEQYGDAITAEELKELLEKEPTALIPTDAGVKIDENGNVVRTMTGLIPVEITYVFNEEGLYETQIYKTFYPSATIAMMLEKSLQAKVEDAVLIRTGSVIEVEYNSYESEKYSGKTAQEVKQMLEEEFGYTENENSGTEKTDE